MALGEQHVYIPANERLFAITRDGTEAWSYELDDGSIGTPTAVGESVLFVENDNSDSSGPLTALTASDGTERWTVDIEDGGGPVVTSNTVFYSSEKGVVALSER